MKKPRFGGVFLWASWVHPLPAGADEPPKAPGSRSTDSVVLTHLGRCEYPLLLIAPTLRVVATVMTVCVIGRGASGAAFPRGAWERSSASAGRVLHLLLIFIHVSADTTHRDLGAGRTQAARSGQRGMDAALAALGHGWPLAACPRSVAGVREPDAVGPNREQSVFGYFCRFYKSDPL